MNWSDLHAWIAIGVTLLVFLGLQLRRSAPPDFLFLAGLVAVTLCGVITPEEAMSGFASPAVLTVAGLLAVSAGLRATGLLDWVGERLLGHVHSEHGARWRLGLVLTASSAFLLNTALVAMMAPVVVDWCRKRNVAPSRLLMLVSYFAILGGVCTLIGTSTSLVVNSQLRQLQQEYAAAEHAPPPPTAALSKAAFADGVRPMRMLEIGRVGAPCALIGMVFLIFAGPFLLPNRTDMLERLGDERREYLVEMLVRSECPLIGKSVEQAGLRHLPGLFLIEIDRRGDIITPVAPEDAIQNGDRLVFTGVVSTIVDLEKIPGLAPAADSTYEFHPHIRQRRHLTEVVLSRTSPLIGTTIREANFRAIYGAAVVAVHRNGVRLTNKIGSIRLEPGDTLLLQTRTEFVSRYRNSRDFYLVGDVEGSSPRRHDRMWLSAGLLLLLAVWLVCTNFLHGVSLFSSLGSPPLAAITVAALMVATKCLRMSDARAAIDIQLIVTIAAALGLGRALTTSGAAGNIATVLISVVGEHPFLLLAVVYLLTSLFTEMITNNAVAAMFLPLAVAVAWEGGYHPRPFVMAIALAASLSFVTPIGYQTNLMVMGPGGYKPSDYFRVGAPLAILIATAAILLIPRIWPFFPAG